MKRILAFALLSIAAPCFAAGGTCPSASNYLSLTAPAGSQIALSAYGITSCYFVAASGSDSNNGTTESTPWLHAPFMPSCSGNCATVTSQSAATWQGEGVIFRGGDTWHFGNSSLTASGCSAGYEGGTWVWNTGTSPVGSASHPIYLGVDQSWYCSGSWSRPIFTGDNPLCNSGNVGTGGCTLYTGAIDQTYYVTSCAYQNGGSNNRLIDVNFVKYYIIDNFELTGLCQSNLGQTGHNDDYVDLASIGGPDWFLNLYIHGWSHLIFGGNNGSGGCTGSTTCFNIFAFDGSTSSGTPAETFFFDVIDGSDSDPGAAGSCLAGAYDTAYSVILYTSQCIANDFHLFHDNIYGDFYENGHSNMMESNNQAETAGTNAMYNNLLYNLETTGSTGGYGFAFSPPVGTTDYIFNNVWYNVGQLQNALSVSSSNSANVGPIIAFNNTIQLHAGLTGTLYGCPPAAITSNSTFVNNHYVTDGSTIYNATNCSGSKTPTTVTNLTMTNATATTDGYTSAQTYVFSPPTGASPTVGAGTNEGTINAAYCSALSTAAGSDSTLSNAVSACSNDTRYGIVYNVSSHTATYPGRTAIVRPSSAAWDIGAYEFSGFSGSYLSNGITVNSGVKFQ